MICAEFNYRKGLFINITNSKALAEFFGKHVGNVEIYEIQDTELDIQGDLVKINDWSNIKHVKTITKNELLNSIRNK